MNRFVFTFIAILVYGNLFAHELTPVEHCLTTNSYEDRYASYSPNGEWILFESKRGGQWGIYLMDKFGQRLQKLSKNEYNSRRPSWHPNGKRIIYESERRGKQGLYTKKIKSKRTRKLKAWIPEGKLMFPSYSSSGQLIAVSHKLTDEESRIVLLKKNGKFIRSITQNNLRNYYPKWSNNGMHLLFFSRKDTDNQDDEIYRLDLKTSREKRLTTWPAHNFCPSWSSDDKQIVYVTSIENSRPEIFIMDHDGENKMRITFNDDGETLPNWHPYENKILMTAYRNGNYEICELSW